MIDVSEVVEEQIGPLAQELRARVVSGGDGDRRRPEGPCAFDVERRIADDEYLLGTKRMPDERVSATRGERRQPPPVGVVGPERPDREVGPESRRPELDASALLDIAGEQPSSTPAVSCRRRISSATPGSVTTPPPSPISSVRPRAYSSKTSSRRSFTVSSGNPEASMRSKTMR